MSHDARQTTGQQPAWGAHVPPSPPMRRSTKRLIALALLSGPGPPLVRFGVFLWAFADGGTWGTQPSPRSEAVSQFGAALPSGTAGEACIDVLEGGCISQREGSFVLWTDEQRAKVTFRTYPV
ncbi:hypothetical protein ACIQU4_13560 [Streptomyces sp. NPDC090741]|uniref:hypothetical protein n=1 Tax=Streptomyces sp. NPDC090741 TaxID=3365967 RepID=UPI003809F02B